MSKDAASLVFEPVRRVFYGWATCIRVERTTRQMDRGLAAA
jgi:hypothetical protein